MILGLDTTGPYCSVSLVGQASVKAHICEKINRGHAERLAPMVAEVLAEAGTNTKDITRLAVCTGPGSFTGLRVALAFAKGFALPRSLPVIGIDALAVRYFQHDAAGINPALIYRDIRREEIMFAVYGGQMDKPQISPNVGSMKQAQAKAKSLDVEMIEADKIDTRILAWLAENRDPADYPAAPLYSRPPDAKLPSAKGAKK